MGLEAWSLSCHGSLYSLGKQEVAESRTGFHKAWLPLRPASSEGRLGNGGLHVVGLQGSRSAKSPVRERAADPCRRS